MLSNTSVRVVSRVSATVILSTSLPKNSIRTTSSAYASDISTVSPFTRNLPRDSSASLRTYCASTNCLSRLSIAISSPFVTVKHVREKSCGLPIPYRQLTELTTTTSFRPLSSAAVALSLRRSISSLILKSFSMYVSVEGI